MSVRPAVEAGSVTLSCAGQRCFYDEIVSTPRLDLSADPIALTAALVDIPSVSRDESQIADAVEDALRTQTSGFQVVRHGNCVLARTERGRPSRVILAGHLDTVPIVDNVPSRRTVTADRRRRAARVRHRRHEVGRRGLLHLAATLDDPAHDLMLIFYDCEEIAAEFNGLGAIERELPDWLRATSRSSGAHRRADRGGMPGHPARPLHRDRHARALGAGLMGDNAVHKLGSLLTTLAAYRPRRVNIDGCEYREGLSAVGISGGVAGNVIPDAAYVDVNFRFAPTAAPRRHSSTSARCSRRSSRPVR